MKIICIGRNYVNHAKELNNAVPTEPVYFLKPETALLFKGRPFYYPDFTSDLHYEIELVVKINRVGKHIPVEFAHRYYKEIGLGIDFTARDLQQKAKEKGLPWEKAKGFDSSAPISEFINIKKLGNLKNLPFSLTKNNSIVQEGNSSNMIFNIDTIIAYVSKFMTLKMGDLIFTGTPEGVGPVVVGDQLTGYIGDEKMLQVAIL